MDSVLEMLILFGLRERPRQIQMYIYREKTSLLHFLCATDSYKISVSLLRKGWELSQESSKCCKKRYWRKWKRQSPHKRTSTCKAIYVMKSKQKSQDNLLPLEE